MSTYYVERKIGRVYRWYIIDEATGSEVGQSDFRWLAMFVAKRISKESSQIFVYTDGKRVKFNG